MTRLGRTARAIVAIGVMALTAPIVAQEQHQHDAASRATMESRREAWQKVDDVFKAMGVKPGAVVADIGAGEGFFTARLARAVGASGRVYAVDVSARSLANLRKRVSDEQLTNVEVVEGGTDDPKLPAGTLDAALIVNAYHEMNEHQAMLTKIKASLKPDGRLVIIEPIAPARREAARADQTRTHEIAVDYVQKEAREAGFRVMTLQDPFTSRANARDDEWLLVLTPVSAVPAAPSPLPAIDRKDEEWKSPDLRISVADFKRLAANDVLVVDVRDALSYRDGHLPGSVLITIEDIAAGKANERLRAERRTIVTYCS
jgi:ubiquinone/menaquinone biosynthesis C-methylase UbiE